MTKGILHRIAQEGANEEGLDTDAVLAEQDSAEPGPEAAAAGSEEDTSADEAVAEDNADAPSDDEAAEEEEVANKPIEYPDIDNLEVDKVYEQLAEEEAERDARSQEALDASKELSQAIEALQLQIAQEGSLTPWTAKQAGITLNKIRARVGFSSPTTAFSMESYAHFNQADSHAALEAFQETFQALNRAVLASLHASLAWLLRAFEPFFGEVQKDLALTERLTQAILSLRGEEEADAGLHPAEEKHYVALPGYKHLLSLVGKQPGEYTVPEISETHSASGKDTVSTWPQALHAILVLAQQHRRYQEHINVDLSDALARHYAGAFGKDGQTPQEERALSFNPIALLQPGYYESSPLAPIEAMRGCDIYVNDFFLGSFKVVTRVASKEPKTLQDSLEIIGDWETAVCAQPHPTNDGSMGFLSSAVLREASGVVMSIEQELLAYEKTVDKVRDVEERLKKLGLVMASSLKEAGGDFLTEGVANKWRGEMLNDAMRAINSIVGNTNRTLYDHATRAQQCCKAWNAYLAEILAKEHKTLGR